MGSKLQCWIRRLIVRELAAKIFDEEEADGRVEPVEGSFRIGCMPIFSDIQVEFRSIPFNCYSRYPTEEEQVPTFLL